MAADKAGLKKGIRITLCIIGAVLLLIAVLFGIKLWRVKHKTTADLHNIAKVPNQNVYYANASDTAAVVRVESEIELQKYAASYEAEITVSGEVTKLTVGHQDVMGMMLPCLSYEFKVDKVLNPSAPAAPEG